MGLKGLLRRKIDAKQDQWRREKNERQLQETGYKMAYQAELRDQMSTAMREQVKKNARADARAEISRRFPGKGQRGGGRAGSIIEGLNAASQGAMGTMGFGPSLREQVRARGSSGSSHKKKKSGKKKKRSSPRQPEYQGLSFI